jgi:hypothetical protein
MQAAFGGNPKDEDPPDLVGSVGWYQFYLGAAQLTVDGEIEALGMLAQQVWQASAANSSRSAAAHTSVTVMSHVSFVVRGLNWKL